MDWGELFFYLHKHCKLNKWEIWDYTLPQVEDLIKRTNKYIQFEIELKSASMGMFGGGAVGGGESSNSTTFEDTDYHEVTNDDLNILAKALGG